MSIKIENLSKNFGKHQALKNVSFEISKGEIVALLGLNGAGKSTLMKSICGVLDISQGDVKVNNQSVKKESLKTKLAIGYLAENNPIYDEMSVKDYLNFVAQLRKAPKKSVSEVIGSVKLNNREHQKIKSLSKGYKQRLGLAQAILNEANIIILDEPTSGLDPKQIIEIRQLIKELGKNKTVLLSTHIMQEVEQVCDRILFLKNGELVMDDSTKTILEKFASLEDAFKILN